MSAWAWFLIISPITGIVASLWLGAYRFGEIKVKDLFFCLVLGGLLGVFMAIICLLEAIDMAAFWNKPIWKRKD